MKHRRKSMHWSMTTETLANDKLNNFSFPNKIKIKNLWAIIQFHCNFRNFKLFHLFSLQNWIGILQISNVTPQERTLFCLLIWSTICPLRSKFEVWTWSETIKTKLIHYLLVMQIFDGWLKHDTIWISDTNRYINYGKIHE